MLTPEKLSSYEFNKITEIYNQLNIDLTADIIRRISKTGQVTATSKIQLKTLLETNGDEIFNKALLETAKLDSRMTAELKAIYTDMAKENMSGFQYLYDYRGQVFKLSETQYQILNAGMKSTANNLSNFTNSIAFNSKTLYIDAVDEAYRKVVTGGFDYNTAIKQAYNDVAKKGITLTDSAGRDVKLDVAVRRNVLTGIQQTANAVNRDIEVQLGCDGYEVTAHTGARDTHAAAQGKQYAQSKADATRYKVDFWNDVKDLWNEANCRHTYFGIILGLSEPQYSKKEIKDMNTAEVTLNGKKVPYYEATQKQRSIERDIRQSKRERDSLKVAGQDYSDQNKKLNELYKDYNNFSNETGLIKQSERLYVIRS